MEKDTTMNSSSLIIPVAVNNNNTLRTNNKNNNLTSSNGGGSKKGRALSFFHQLVYRLFTSPYNLPYEMTMEIIKYISFEEAVNMGATEREVDFIASINPPKNITRLGDIEKLEEECRLIYSRNETRPWVFCELGEFKYYIRNYTKQLVDALEYTHPCLDIPLKSFLSFYGRLDLIKVLYKEIPSLFIGENHFVKHAAYRKDYECLKYLVTLPGIYVDPSFVEWAHWYKRHDILEIITSSKCEDDVDVAASAVPLFLPNNKKTQSTI